MPVSERSLDSNKMFVKSKDLIAGDIVDLASYRGVIYPGETVKKIWDVNKLCEILTESGKGILCHKNTWQIVDMTSPGRVAGKHVEEAELTTKWCATSAHISFYETDDLRKSVGIVRVEVFTEDAAKKQIEDFLNYYEGSAKELWAKTAYNGEAYVWRVRKSKFPAPFTIRFPSTLEVYPNPNLASKEFTYTLNFDGAVIPVRVKASSSVFTYIQQNWEEIYEENSRCLDNAVTAADGTLRGSMRASVDKQVFFDVEIVPKPKRCRWDIRALGVLD